MKYLKEFVIGSSIAVVAPFYYMVYNHQPNKQYSYYDYSLIAPVWFGLWNIVSLVIAKHYGLSKRMRFFVISVLSYISIISISTYFKTYNQTREEWNFYYLQQFIKYMLVWNIVIYNLDKYI